MPHDAKKPTLSGTRQMMLPHKSLHVNVISQDKVDELIVNYIIEEARPLCTVEKPAFKELIHGLSPSHSVMCRKTLSKKLSDKHATFLFDIRQQLVTQPAVCTTADIWSCLKKSYLGVTAHWITDDLKRHSAALACSRMMGSHTYDVVAEHLMNIHSDFGLDHTKISFTVTDNGSHMVKAFAEYQEQEVGPEQIWQMRMKIMLLITHRNMKLPMRWVKSRQSMWTQFCLIRGTAMKYFCQSICDVQVTL
jgi:hypothetical protein